jgi:XTP/dITP diphosphohydrolase
MTRLSFVVTSPRLPAGLLSRPAWDVLAQVPVFAAAGSATVAAVRDAGIDVVELDPEAPATADTLLGAGRDIAWLAGPAGDAALTRRLAERLAGPAAPDVDLELVPGSWDPPGARLLDAVAVMDRLRSPGGCPWDAEQTHESLAPYLIEEAYETLDAIETGEREELRAELGDLLLQVLFHARLGQEGEPAWSIDDVAAGLVDKLIRRHPHVFDARQDVNTAADVDRNWEQIKAAERAGRSAYAGVPLGQPALQLATALQRKSTRDGHRDPVVPEPEEYADVAALTDGGQAARLLWAVVARCRSLGVDAEAELRGLSRHVRDDLMTREAGGAADAAGQPGGATPQR